MIRDFDSEQTLYHKDSSQGGAGARNAGAALASFIYQYSPIFTDVVLGKSDGTAYGGHILEAHVWPTLEVIVVEAPAHLRRTTDEETGLALINL